MPTAERPVPPAGLAESAASAKLGDLVPGSPKIEEHLFGVLARFRCGARRSDRAAELHRRRRQAIFATGDGVTYRQVVVCINLEVAV